MNAIITWVYTSDLAGTAKFYAETIGLAVAMEQKGTSIFHVGRDGFLGVCTVRPGRSIEPKGVVITLVVDDVDAWYERLTSAGLRMQKPLENPEFDIYHFFATDPNGYLLEFQTFRDPRWRAMRKAREIGAA